MPFRDRMRGNNGGANVPRETRANGLEVSPGDGLTRGSQNEAVAEYGRAARTMKVRAQVALANVSDCGAIAERYETMRLDLEHEHECRLFRSRHSKWFAMISHQRDEGTAVVHIAGRDERKVLHRMEQLVNMISAEQQMDGVRVNALVNGDAFRQFIRTDDWADIGQNYVSPVRDQLDVLMKGPRDGRSGRLMIMTGAPGTGKTTAISAMIREWSRLGFEVEIHTGQIDNGIRAVSKYAVAGGANGPMRLVVLEESGELLKGLTADAINTLKGSKSESLKSILEISDGLTTRNSNVHVLITSNLRSSEFDPAVLRPGRCSSLIDFREHTRSEASEWLGFDATRAMVLAEMYEVQRTGVIPPEDDGPTGVYAYV